MLVGLHGTDVFIVKVHVRIVLFLLEPTDVVIVGVSQTFAEMFFSFYIFAQFA
jgi:hypothetical protein